MILLFLSFKRLFSFWHIKYINCRLISLPCKKQSHLGARVVWLSGDLRLKFSGSFLSAPFFHIYWVLRYTWILSLTGESLCRRLKFSLGVWWWDWSSVPRQAGRKEWNIGLWAAIRTPNAATAFPVPGAGIHTLWGHSGSSYSSLGCSLGTVAIVIPTSEHTNSLWEHWSKQRKMIPVVSLFPGSRLEVRWIQSLFFLLHALSCRPWVSPYTLFPNLELMFLPNLTLLITHTYLLGPVDFQNTDLWQEYLPISLEN